MNWLYLMIHIPFFIFVKIGITGKSAKHRASGINKDKKMIGWAIPVFAMLVPNARYYEAALHRHCKGINVKFLKSSGKNEWFVFFAAIPYFLVVAFWSVVYVAIFYVFVFVIKNL